MTLFIPSVLLAAAVSAGATGLPMAQEQAPMAQAASPDADKIRRRVKDGQKIVVTDDQGRTLSGRIGELRPDALMLLVGRDTTKVPYDRIVSIDRPRDRLWDGALVGLVVGAGIGAVAAASDDSSWGSVVALGYPPMFGGIGALVFTAAPVRPASASRPRWDRVIEAWRSPCGGKAARVQRNEGRNDLHRFCDCGRADRRRSRPGDAVTDAQGRYESSTRGSSSHAPRRQPPTSSSA